VKEFVRRTLVQRDDVLGARWWNESFTAFVEAGQRRLFLKKALTYGAGTAFILIGARSCARGSGDRDDSDDTEVSLEAIQLQRREGWDVGHRERALAADDYVTLDAEASGAWRDHLETLAGDLAPEDRLQPYAVPTLFQSLADPSSGSLRRQIRPTHDLQMEETYERGRAFLDVARSAEAPADLAIVSDLPGPTSVALAAALAPRFCPVFIFDNWPHPLGVVPSHDTLGACLYYLPVFQQARRTRPTPAPPLFVLDANRLAPYRDAATQFDNRYLAPLPSAASLTGLGVRRILYLRPDDHSLTELDDLNDDFVNLERAGIQVRALSLADFVATGSPARPVYYYGGGPHYHSYFWRSYHWGPSLPSGLAPRSSPSLAYRPVSRPTIFASRSLGGMSGVGRQKPSGFGRVSVRVGAAGQVTSYGSIRRSGSFGRSRSSSYG
jgi:hypothetical protein